MRKENRRREIVRLWNLCKETNCIEIGCKLHVYAMRMEGYLKERLTRRMYFQMAGAVACFAKYAQDKRFAEILLHKLERYYK